MEIYGKERNFALTTQAWADLSKICPNEDFENLSSLLTGSDSAVVENGAKIAAILNKNGELKARFEGQEYNEPLPAEAFGALSIPEFMKVMSVIRQTIIDDQTVTIETKSVKKNEPMKE